MAGKKKPTPVTPAPSSARRNRSVAPSPKKGPKDSAVGGKASSSAKPRKISKEKTLPTKKKGDKPEPEAGAKKRKKQQGSGEAGTPAKKKGKKRDEAGSAPNKKAASTKKQQSPGKPKNPAPKPAKQQQKQPSKSVKLAKKQLSPGKAGRPAAAATTPTKKQQEAKREKQKVPGGSEKTTPNKRKRGDEESQLEAWSPNRASGKGDAGAPTPVKKKQKDKKAAVADIGTCSFPMARVRQLMRAEDDTIRASSEAVFLINKASEFFLEKFADNAYSNALKDRKKSIIYDNLSTTVCNEKCFKFLSDFVPQRLRAEDALKTAAPSQL